MQKVFYFLLKDDYVKKNYNFSQVEENSLYYTILYI